MKVVIVAKTRMGGGACVGGVTFAGQSVRLIAPGAAEHDAFNMEYQLGDVWELVDYEIPALTPPHVENIVVQRKRRLPPIDDLAAFVAERMAPVSGGPGVLFEGLAQHTASGVLYIAERSGVPAYSTMFWRPVQPLRLDDSGKRIRYRYRTPDGGRTLTFVGFQEPVDEIAAGTLLRVSLAHWWRAPARPDHELRCYVQLSGWLDEEPLWPANPFEAIGVDRSLPLPPLLERERPAPDEAPAEQARRLLKHVFGFDDYRPLQEEIVGQLLQGEDALAVMPTGSGKSLCFQLPALLVEGLTVVVSPLIALMQDQVEQLRELDVPAVFLNSTLTYEQYLQTVQAIRKGRVKLLYAAPETLLRPETLHLLEQATFPAWPLTRPTASQNGATTSGRSTASWPVCARGCRKPPAWPSRRRPRNACGKISCSRWQSLAPPSSWPALTARTCCSASRRAPMGWRRLSISWRPIAARRASSTAAHVIWSIR
jgi:ATP-dependent DNA helicase RecQ